MPTHYRGDARIFDALNAFIKFNRAFSSLESRLMHRDVLEGLTLTQFGVLETLYHLGSMCQGEISVKVLRSTGNITLVLDNLERNGLITRTRDTQDRRKVIVALTDEGRERIARVFPGVASAITAEMSVLDPAELAELERLCKKLGKSAN